MTGRLSAVVLAGGRSKRFGEQDKALVAVDDTPMIRRVAESVSAVADELVVNCRDAQRPALETALDGLTLEPRFATDPIPDRGPVYGLRTGLRYAAGERAVVVACDMPDVDPALLDALRVRAATSDQPATLPRLDGHRRYLPGIYGVDRTRIVCERAVARDDRRLTAVLDELDALVVDESDPFVPDRPVTNVNTPADLEATAPDS